MCGIVVVISEYSIHLSNLMKPLEVVMPRGPDDNCTRIVHSEPDVIMTHSRLRTHPSSVVQPLRTRGWSIVCNGELYNHTNDCLALPLLLSHHGKFTPKYIDGVFAFVGFHPKHGFVACRDPVGVVPLYVGTVQTPSGRQLWFASMERALEHCDEVNLFPPGYSCSGTLQNTEWSRYTRPYVMPFEIPDPMPLRDLLARAVAKRIKTCNTTMAVFLSGGLDSSIIAALACKFGHVRTYSIGLQGSPDLIAAREVADFLGTDHHEVHFTVSEGLAAIPDVIRAVETCDITTVRASVPMYLLSRKIKEDGVRVMLSGEGADELFAGYAYNKYAPDPKSLFKESVEKMELLHAYDCQRANKTCAAFGIECRVPFLDKDVVEFAMNRLHPKQKMWNVLEKEVLRDAFIGALPTHILMRKKAQFSDAVGSAWITACRESFPEHDYYSTLYKATCPHEACLFELETVACSTRTGAQWVDAVRDPSGIIKV